MWSCKLCGVHFALESIEHHLLANHSKSSRFKVYGCGECHFSAKSFEEIAVHCLSTEHEPKDVTKGSDFNKYMSELFNALDRSMDRRQHSERTLRFADAKAENLDRSLSTSSSINEEKNGDQIISYNETESFVDNYRDESTLKRTMMGMKSINQSDQEVFEQASRQKPKTEDQQTEREQIDRLISKGSLLSATGSDLKTKGNSSSKVNIDANDVDDFDGGKKNASLYETINNFGQSPTAITRPPLSKTSVFNKRSRLRKSSSSNPFLTPNHTVLPNGRKVYPCSYCPKTFACPSRIYGHERIHTGERPYQCSFCQKFFGQPSHLKTHQRTHTGEKPYDCSVCGRKFRRADHLSAHRHRSHPVSGQGQAAEPSPEMSASK